MLGILFSLFTICFLASSVDVFLYFFPLLFAKYIMTLYLPWPRALRPLCGFTILAISQINHRSLCRNITVYMKTALFSGGGSRFILGSWIATSVGMSIEYTRSYLSF